MISHDTPAFTLDEDINSELGVYSERLHGRGMGFGYI